MFKNIALLFVFSLFLGSYLTSQVSTGVYHSPLGIPLEISATFGDLRPNHFHMGLDFKTGGVTGVNIHSIADGYISRVKIMPLGYGKVIYIDHPNGITSVYAHCSSFKEPLASFIKKYQEHNKLNEIDLKLTPSDFPVKIGQIIALSGNSGNSTGPHLHFELRDTKTEKGLNPLQHGFVAYDKIAPSPEKILIYLLDKDGYLIPNNSRTFPIVKSGNTYSLKNGKIVLDPKFIAGYSKIGIAITGQDQGGKIPSKFGLFEQILVQEKDTLYHCKIDTISFDHNRFINDYCDYVQYKKNGSKIHKLFYKEDNLLDIYKSEPFQIVDLSGNDSIPLTISLLDANQNKSQIGFTLVNRTKSVSQKPFFETGYLSPDSTYFFEQFGNSISIPAHSFYEPVQNNLKIISNGISIGNADIAVHDSIKIILTPLPNIDISKQYIAQIGANGSKTGITTKIIQGKLTAYIYNFGNYALSTDKIAPTIAPDNFKTTDTLIKTKKLQWKISDGQTSVSSYQLLINNQWKILEYDKKNNTIFHVIDKNEYGKKKYNISIKDACGNEANWSQSLNVD